MRRMIENGFVENKSLGINGMPMDPSSGAISRTAPSLAAFAGLTVTVETG
jgi:hypothetical protein